MAEGCRTAGIGCVDCKKILIKNVLARLTPMREKRLQLEARMDDVHAMIADGIERARKQAVQAMDQVRHAIGLG